MANLDAETRAIIRDIGFAMAEDARANNETKRLRVEVKTPTGDSALGSVAYMLLGCDEGFSRTRRARRIS